jgi:preprotein translocase subunit SecD
MLDFSPMRKFMLSAIVLIGILLAIPAVMPGSMLAKIPDFLPKNQINLGLDLAGGSHILLEADTSQLGKARLDALEDSVLTAMNRADPKISVDGVSRSDGNLSFMVTDVAQLDKARERILPIIANSTTGGRDWNLSVVDGNRITLSPAVSGDAAALDDAMDTAKDVIEKRINAIGTLEPTIIRQGDDRIVVQVPGLDDPEKLKALIGKTAKLEFKLVDDEADPVEVAKGNVRVGSQIVPDIDSGGFLAVRRLGGISGDKLVKADSGVDQDGQNVVNIQFDSEGGQKFARMTQQYTGKRFAIILDGQSISAPVIKDAILGGASQISGSFTPETANDLAISLRSGALPIDLKVIEERSVGPDLGKDSIERGVLAAVIGTVAVLIIMFATYGRFGMYANGALIINMAMILSVMAAINATLTLPGIAGFVLTVGASVDANVLINERIREESRRGRRIVAAIENGYKEASRAIFDANITNVIAATLMFIFGSGPIRGFAVVLMIGIVTSVFTAVVITRMWVSGWLKRARPQELVI